MKSTEAESRAILPSARRIVVKVGTRVLVDSDGRPQASHLKKFVRDIAVLHRRGVEIVLVTSGAIGAGMAALKLKRRPKTLPDLQMAAAVGQSRLMALYQQLFEKEGIVIGQVLLTNEDLRHRVRHLNARNTMLALLRNRIVPVVNENDTVTVDEIKFGDNDVLAALVSSLIAAEVLVLMSTTNGLQRKVGKRSVRVGHVAAVTEKELALTFGKSSELTVGGMSSKLKAAQTAVHSGALALIVDGRRKGALLEVLSGADRGTLIGGLKKNGRNARKRWIADFNRASGELTVDAGAREALQNRGRSLLPIGLKDVHGKFDKGSLVTVRDSLGALIARGLVEYGDKDLRQIAGKKSSEIASVLGFRDSDEVIHRDNLVLITDSTGMGA